MEPSDLIKHVCRHLERMRVRYLITGSQATIAYGEPRFTNDIDIVVDLTPAMLDSFCAAFPESDFYLSQAAARNAVATRGKFNIIHPASGLKVDVIIPKQMPHDKLRLSRGIRVPVDDEFKAMFASPEDIILKKLEWHQMGGGERHLRDIAGVVKTRGSILDREYIEQQADALGVRELWHDVLARIDQK
jgi:hypothetical protein